MRCHRCIMDSTAVEFKPNEMGCNFCVEAQKSLHDTFFEQKKLDAFLGRIRGSGGYDCLIGLSGGVDSSYTLLKALEWGLKPLCFSVENGWQSDKAQENIMKLVEGFKVPYFRYTIDLEKFKKLQSAFMIQGQKNIEIPTDHILLAVTYEIADTYGIKWILSGGNVATESIMPASWGYNARDLIHIKDVYRKTYNEELTGLPMCSLLKYNYYLWWKKIKIFYPLDYIEYDREKAIKELEKVGYESYGEKHCESIFTHWFQNFYLFEKFGIDKRKAHLSSLIVSGQITREEALQEIESNPVYPKLGIESKVMKYKKRNYKEFKTDEFWYNLIRKTVKLCVF